MAGVIERFEDFIAWQKARVLTSALYRVTGEGSFSRDFPLRDQIRGAAISIMSNIAEGFERGKPPEFHQFLCIAKGSCAEVRSQLYIALDARHIDQAQFDHLLALAEEVGRLVGGLRLSVERRRDG
ncbi:MAG TPA: four helix bundle protein [Gemmataceae bacterium]|nr:four helix bundle protein [Gemmataceae bacterium]